jgi:peptidoglycan/xylan/chitin deacetylase (PgdA/CDA1 family)
MSVRYDRFLSILLYKIFKSAFAEKGARAVPILMYHSISPADSNASHPYYEINTATDIFRLHMGILKKQGYTAVGLETLVGNTSPQDGGKRVIITFDDGFRDFYTTAFPILREFGFTATVFLPTQFIGSNSPGLRDKYHLSWQEVRTLADQQIEFGSHTVTHCLLVNENESRVSKELKESKKVIEDQIGQKIYSFAYPYAFPDHRKKFTASLRTKLIETGYSCGVTTKIGLANSGDDRYFLKRIPLNSFDDEELFNAKLNGAYDWLNMPQYLLKNVKMLLSSIHLRKRF